MDAEMIILCDGVVIPQSKKEIARCLYEVFRKYGDRFH